MELYLTDKGEKRLEKLQASGYNPYATEHDTDSSNYHTDFLLLNNIKLDGESDIEELLAHPEIYNRDRALLYRDAHRRLFEAGYIEKG